MSTPRALMTLLPAFYTMRQSDPALFIIASILVQCPYLFLPLSLIAQSKKKKTSLALNPGAWKPTVYKVLLLSVTCSLLGTPSTQSCPLFPDSLVNSGSRPAEDKHSSLEASKARAYQDGSALRRG